MKNALLIIIAVLSVVIAPVSSAARETDVPAAEGDTSSVYDFAIWYKCDSTDINATYLDNAEQLSRIRHYIENSPRIDSITIYSWASPEGGAAHNRWLSQERGRTARRFLLSLSPDSLKLDSGKIRLCPLSENWPGLVDMVERHYTRHDREKVLNILRNDKIGDETRKWRLQQLDGGYTWKYLIRRYMPGLRSATWVCVWAEVIPPLPVPEPIADTLEMPLGKLERPFTARQQVRRRTIAALKTNALYDMASVVNFAVEIPINERFSFLYEHHCPWWLTRNNQYCLQFLSFGGEFRWWFAPKPLPQTDDLKQRDALMGHFIGIQGWGGKFDFQARREFGCYQGEFMSLGVTYGYAFPIGKWMNLELSVTAGYASIPYRHYIPTPDWSILVRDPSDLGTLHYFGPTKAEVSLVIPIRAVFNNGRRNR